MPGADVIRHRQVRKQHVVLEQKGRFTLLRRQVDLLLGIEEHLAIHNDPALIRRLDARDAAQREALAAPGGPQKAQSLIAARKSHVQGVVAEALLDAHVQAHLGHPLSQNVGTSGTVLPKALRAPPSAAAPRAVSPRLGRAPLVAALLAIARGMPAP